jgi:hypothetical protein
VHRSPTIPRALRLGFALVAVAMLAASMSATALAKQKSCAEQIVGDWFDDGRVGKIYPLKCYTLAIASLPPDVLDYSNAKEEIARALAFAKQGKQDPGGEDPTPAVTGTDPADTTTTGTDQSGPGATTSSSTDPTATGTDTTDVQRTDTSGPSAVPIPLLVLGGLAVLLVAAGSAGYLRRRMNGADSDGDGTPPAAV